jgi:hypothetical protein
MAASVDELRAALGFVNTVAIPESRQIYLVVRGYCTARRQRKPMVFPGIGLPLGAMSARPVRDRAKDSLMARFRQES